MSELQPARIVWGLVNSHVIARCVHVVADASMADTSEYEALLGAADFRLERVVPASSQYSIVEAVPA